MKSSLDLLSILLLPSPLPDLPLEIEHHILKFCDSPTLAVTSRASLAFLELSIALLHENIIIRGYDQMRKMCVYRLPSEYDNQVSSLLDLDRRPIHSFTFLALDSDQDVQRIFSLDRFQTWRSLPVQHLDIQVAPDVVGRIALLDLHGRVYSRVLLARNMFPLFDPHYVSISGLLPPPPPSSLRRRSVRDSLGRAEGDGPLAYLNLDRSAFWLNLRCISFNASSGPFEPLTKSQFARAPHRRPFSVGFDFSNRWPVPRPALIHQHDVVSSNMEELMGGTRLKMREDENSLLASRLVERVMVKVKGKEQKNYLLKWMRGFWDRDGVVGEERERREGKIRWETVDAGNEEE